MAEKELGKLERASTLRARVRLVSTLFPLTLYASPKMSRLPKLLLHGP